MGYNHTTFCKNIQVIERTNMSERQSSFWPALAGMTIGAAAGAVAMFFLSPRSGRANRRLVADKWDEFNDYLDAERDAITDRVYDIFGEVSAITTSLYDDARRLWESQVKAFEKSLDKIDKKSYQEMVDNVIEKLQASKKYESDDLSKIKRYLNSQWRKLAEEIG